MFFSEGNRVRLLVDYPDGNKKLPAMSVGTVVRDREAFDEVCVAWDMDVGGHSCGGLCEYGHGWNVLREEIELIESEEDIDDTDIADMSEICAFIGI